MSNPQDIGAGSSGIPFGGTVNQVLTKKSSANFDMDWATLGGTNFAVLLTEPSATPATERAIRGEYTLSGTPIVIQANGSIAGVRGAVTLNTGKTINGGFLYGTQGKIIADGATINVGSGHVAGVYAQMSANGATMTSGHIAIIVASGQNLPASANVDAIYIESGAGPINSALKTILNANVVFDISEQNVTDTMLSVTGTAGATATKGWLKCTVKGLTRYIPLTDSVS